MLRDNDDKILFNRTTYQMDYKPWDNCDKTVYNYDRDREEKPPKPTAPLQVTNHETFAPWKDGVKVPFDLLVTPKEIVHTHPKNPFIKLKSALTEKREEVIRTRPRVYMAPACCLDDVPDADMRKLLIEQTYTTEFRKSMKEATENFKPVEPCIAEIGQKDTVDLEIDLYKPLDEKFRIRGKQWDDDQIRGDCDPTKEFWLTKDPPVVCGACVNPLRGIVTEETKQTIKSLVATDNLRLPHDKLSPSYTGYRPRLPVEVSLSKTTKSIAHPLLSTYQVVSQKEKYV